MGETYNGRNHGASVLLLLFKPAVVARFKCVRLSTLVSPSLQTVMRKYLSLYIVIGSLGLAAAFAGFLKTFFIPVSSGTFHAPLIIYIHGVFAFSFVVIFLVQSYLIRAENWPLHMTMGLLGLMAAAGTGVTMPFAGAYQVERDLAQGAGDVAISAILGTFTSALMFLGFVAAGYRFRNRLDAHKRLMLLALIVLLWPAWFRFRHYFPSVPNPEIWFALVLADSLIVIAWIWDKLSTGKIHATLLYGGLLVILEQTLEVIAFDSPAWRAIAKQIYALF